MRARVLTSLVLMLIVGCKKEPADRRKRAVERRKLATAPPDQGRTLLFVQSRFSKVDGEVSGLAVLKLLHRTKRGWEEEAIEDDESDVFHDAVPWRDGILTIAGNAALLKHWRCTEKGWKASTLWRRSWGGEPDRLRDLEIADVDGDGRDEIVLATHDRGVVAIGDEADGKWVFTELGGAEKTFVHEVEVGDVDGDGKPEIYATPSGRNRSSGESQPGGVVRYVHSEERYVPTRLISWKRSHAKEILTADLDRDGKDELYAVREAHTEKKDGKVRIVDPVRVLRLSPGPTGKPWKPKEIGRLEDRQSRFIVAGDVDGDGRRDLVASGMTSGLWFFRQDEKGTFTPRRIDADSGGFEHATHLSDLDGDGRPEIYVAADEQRQLRRYRYAGGLFDRELLVPLDEGAITWNISDGRISPCSRGP